MTARLQIRPDSTWLTGCRRHKKTDDNGGGIIDVAFGIAAFRYILHWEQVTIPRDTGLLDGIVTRPYEVFLYVFDIGIFMLYLSKNQLREIHYRRIYKGEGARIISPHIGLIYIYTYIYIDNSGLCY